MMIAIRNRTGADLYLAKSVSESSVTFTIHATPPKTKDKRKRKMIVLFRKGAVYGVSELPDTGVVIDTSRCTLTLHVEHRGHIVPDDDHGDEPKFVLYHEYFLRLAN